MTISGQYLTYEEYTSLGGTLAETPFNLLEYEARKEIDSRTQRRLVGGTNIPQEVKICDFKLMNIISKYIESENYISSNGNVASESTDGYTIQYLTIEQISNVISSKTSEINDIIRVYLTGVKYNGEHLLFAGVR